MLRVSAAVGEIIITITSAVVDEPAPQPTADGHRVRRVGIEAVRDGLHRRRDARAFSLPSIAHSSLPTDHRMTLGDCGHGGSSPRAAQLLRLGPIRRLSSSTSIPSRRRHSSNSGAGGLMRRAIRVAAHFLQAAQAKLHERIRTALPTPA